MRAWRIVLTSSDSSSDYDGSMKDASAPVRRDSGLRLTGNHCDFCVEEEDGKQDTAGNQHSCTYDEL